VRVVTLNLWGRHGDWERRRAVLRDGLRGLRPDLVAFQEAIVDDGYDQATDLLGDEFVVAHQTVGLLGDGNHAVSVASRWPLEEVFEVRLPVTDRTRDYPCAALVAEILAPDPEGPLLFANHGPAYQASAEHERETQAVTAARLIDRCARGRDLHRVLAGDFNAVADAASMRFWRGLQSLGDTSVCYVDTWQATHPGTPGHTVSPRNPLRPRREPGRRIDCILQGCGEIGPTLDVAACELAFDEPIDGVWASDHFGVVADLAVPTP
jgi:endonuclease/exonuclease/phosphatase family metal-dependent hydrolase